MKLLLASNGSYPRIGSTPELQVLSATLEGLHRGEKTAADLADAQKQMTRHAIAEQARAGIEILTDGLIRWRDPVSHIASKFRGVRIGDSAAYFDTGGKYRQPVLLSRPLRGTNGHDPLVEEFHFARNALGLLPTAIERAGKLSVKPILTGPYTLARLSSSESPELQSVDARARAYAEALALEFRALVDSGADLIQVDEPAILSFPDDWHAFSMALGLLLAARDQARKAGREAKLALCVNFGDAEPLYEKLIRLPVDALLLDFVSSSGLAEKVAAAGSPVPLGLGVVNGGSAKLEDPAAIARQVEPILPKLGGQQAFLGPSCGLEALPPDSAYAKLELLQKVRQAIQG